jgi:putative hemolysin
MPWIEDEFMTTTASLDSGPAPIRAGNLEARLAASDADIECAQALRYRVFYEEMRAVPSDADRQRRRDTDKFDPACDHLLVIDHEGCDESGGVVGTYRLLRRGHARRHGGFYTAGEYDIGCLMNFSGEILELGRSCVDTAYRNRPTMQLLWAAIAGYVFHHDIKVMFGCASLPGSDAEAFALPLSYLYAHHLAPASLRPVALPGRHVPMDRIPAEQIDRKQALAELPPLIRGYLRLGGFVGDGAVVDRQFNTTDICVVVGTDLVTEKYYRHYQRAALHAAEA